MIKNEKLRRFILFLIGLFIMSAGVALTKHASLGVSPISSIPNIFSIKFDKLSLGTWTIIWNIILIIGQIIILKSSFEKYQIIQLPISFLFGIFVDISLYFVSKISINDYISQIILLIFGIFFLSLGVAITVIANFILNSGEAFVKAISDTIKKNFGNIKVKFDIACVIISIVLSLIFFSFQILGTREGTIISAIFTGLIVNIIVKYIKYPLEKIFNL